MAVETRSSKLMDPRRAIFGSGITNFVIDILSFGQKKTIENPNRTSLESSNQFMADMMAIIIRSKVFKDLDLLGTVVNGQVLVAYGMEPSAGSMVAGGLIDDEGLVDENGPVFLELNNFFRDPPNEARKRFAARLVLPHPEAELNKPHLMITFTDGDAWFRPLSNELAILDKAATNLYSQKYIGQLDQDDAEYFLEVYPRVDLVRDRTLQKTKAYLLSTLIGVAWRRQLTIEANNEGLFNDSSLIADHPVFGLISEGDWNEDYVRETEGYWNERPGL